MIPAGKEGRIRRAQVCARCRNHNTFTILKGHKNCCPFLNCTCEKCNETQIRRKFIAKEIAFHRKNSTNLENPKRKKSQEMLQKLLHTPVNLITGAKREERSHQKCARCMNHGDSTPIRGHKNVCPYSHCECSLCQITKERRKIMAKQIKDYRLNKVCDEPETSMAASTEPDSGYNSPENEKEKLHFGPINQVEVPNIWEISSKAPQPPSLIPSFFSRIPPDMVEKFCQVQSLFVNHCLYDTKAKIQLVCALVELAQQNWPLIHNALIRGMSCCFFWLIKLLFLVISSKINFIVF